MIRRDFAATHQIFRVTVGHVSVLVQAGSPTEAVGNARRQMCAEMPRLWDVIAQLEEDRFRVERL
jgi:hypothetical protein